MPWHIAQDVAGCDGWAVVKDSTGEIEGCHATRRDALRQLAALNIAEPDARAESYKPTAEMAAEAQRGLDWRAEYNRGGTMVGVARARDISNRTPLTLDTVRRMVSYFARHEIDKDASGFSPGEDGYPSAGRIAWALWGGDAGRSWANAIADQQEENSMNEQTEERGIDESMYPLSQRQTLQYALAETIVEQHGRYNQSINSEGAHYVDASPFASEGVVCSSCVFYEGPRACELVEGDIDPNGICKLWIIPNDLLQIAPPAEMPMVDEDEEEQPMYEVPRTVPLAIYTRKAQMRDRTYVAPMPVSGSALYSALEIEDRKVNGRTLEMRRLELRLAGRVDQPMRFRGYAAVFNSPSQPLPFIETIKPGAFRRSLMSGKEIRMYLNHNSDQVLASTKSGTLTLREDARGLYVEADLPDTTYGRDLSVLMQRGDVHSMSFGFTIPRNGDSWSSDGTSRELREIILHEVSVVTGFPAYEDTAGATVDVA